MPKNTTPHAAPKKKPAPPSTAKPRRQAAKKAVTSRSAASRPASSDDTRFSDRVTTIENLKDLVRGFISEREWAPYHTPKNVAASVAIEAAELLEHFQWEHPTPAQLSRSKRGEVADEMADVLAYLLSLANVLQIDLADALHRKMAKNRQKYPADRFRGTWEKVRS
ncbi:nucleotide pyrophosphohydrolase [Candidatus Ozemobacteraceae bacterium]|nr:nucleotide pyrophosphohydrolase [Candidatus Ozemobacteraceae bacterium]